MNYTNPLVMKRRLILLIIVLLIVIIALVTSSVFGRKNFRVTSTEPNLSSVSYIAPYLKVGFNEPVETDNIELDDPGQLISSMESNGNTVTMNFRTDMTIDKNYTLSIKRATSSEGSVIQNYDLSFRAKNIPYDKLPAGQRQILDKKQQTKPYSQAFINFENFSILTNNGMTTEQLDYLQRQLIDYSDSVKKQFRNMVIDPSSVVFEPYNPEATDLIQKATFNITLSDEQFKAHIEFDPTFDAVDLELFDTTGKQVYGSSQHTD